MAAAGWSSATSRAPAAATARAGVHCVDSGCQELQARVQTSYSINTARNISDAAPCRSHTHGKQAGNRHQQRCMSGRCRCFANCYEPTCMMALLSYVKPAACHNMIRKRTCMAMCRQQHNKAQLQLLGLTIGSHGRVIHQLLHTHLRGLAGAEAACTQSCMLAIASLAASFSCRAALPSAAAHVTGTKCRSSLATLHAPWRIKAPAWGRRLDAVGCQHGCTCVIGHMYSTGARPSRPRRGARPVPAACMASSCRFMAASCASCARSRAACSCACFACARVLVHPFSCLGMQFAACPTAAVRWLPAAPPARAAAPPAPARASPAHGCSYILFHVSALHFAACHPAAAERLPAGPGR